ncbi:MAG TPA: hypothetical protein VNO14_19470 [Blastocatellia bacterium]|nr:hypothetical protein [Blastocatellia bacterium]
MATQINRRDLPWIVLIAVSFIFGLAVSWERWGNLLVDCGREMNQPLRLAEGQMLYSDVRHIYGPLSPYLNAALYRVFEPSLYVLYGDGIVTAIIIIALVYWLSRQLLDRAAAAAAALSVMWLCAFKQAGNYILPYSYSALHGCALGLATLALVLRFAQLISSHRALSAPRACLLLLSAGVCAGLTLLAKTEMGLAAVLTGLVAVIISAYPNLKRAASLAALFSVAAGLPVTSVYAIIGVQVGFHVLSNESYLFFQNLPAELVYYNRRMSGFDQPLLSLAGMIGAAIRTAALAAVVASIALLLAHRRKKAVEPKIALAGARLTDAGRISYSQLWMMLAGSLILLALPLGGHMQWEKGPYLAMPLFLAAMLIAALMQYQKQLSKNRYLNPHTLAIIIISTYALASLARMLLRVRSGGAYSSYLLPASVIMFTYCWTGPFVKMFRESHSRKLARNLALGLLFVWIAATMAVMSYRFRSTRTYQISTARGTIFAPADLGRSLDEAIAFINRETAPGEPIAVMPEGTSLSFLTERPNPLREEITTPGYLDAEGERRAIERLKVTNTRLVFITNRATPEFGPAVFGKDYCQTLMRWIEENFEQCAVFGPDHTPDLQIGNSTFFIRAYRKKPTT